jgi:geranylgeranyl diphosphate synthase type I
MHVTSAISLVFLRYQQDILHVLRNALTQISNNSIRNSSEVLSAYYGQMQYHLGWVDEHFSPVSSHPGKLLRPTLLLLSYEIAGAWGLATEPSDDHRYLQRALPAAAAVELAHNFTLIHDDIEDADIERRHRPTVWKIWGIPQGINTGDGMIFLAHLALWYAQDDGIDSGRMLRLGQILDHALLTITEGQYLDLSFERLQHVSVEKYVDMIGRKTATLLSCSAEMGALLGCNDTTLIESLRRFGWSLGIAFQVRDDLLGIWDPAGTLGKTSTGDIYRRKKSLPVIHAFSVADEKTRRELREIYQQDMPLTEEQVERVLTIFERMGTQAYCRQFLAQQYQQARQALTQIPRTHTALADRAYADMQTLIRFLEETV